MSPELFAGKPAPTGFAASGGELNPKGINEYVYVQCHPGTALRTVPGGGRTPVGGKINRSLLTFWLILLLAGCGTSDDSPEQRLRGWVARGEAAAEARSLTEFKALISEQYRDQSGRTRRDVVRLAARYFLGHRSIHLLTQVQGMTLVDPERAQLILIVAIAGRPFPDPEHLLGFRADLYRFDLELVLEEDEWQVIDGSWHSVGWKEFLE
jgi:hypothetical protein